MARYYDVYFYKFPEHTVMPIIEKSVEAAYKLINVGVSLKDLTTYGKIKIGGILNSFINSERKKVLRDSDKNLKCYYLKISPKDWLLVVFADNTPEWEEKAKQLFRVAVGKDVYKMCFIKEEHKENPLISKGYWKDKLKDKPAFKTVQKNNNNGKEQETFFVDNELFTILKATEKTLDELKIIFTTTWCQILSKTIKDETCIFEDMHDGGMLDYMPLTITLHKPVDYYLENIDEQLRDGARNDNISNGELNSVVQYAIGEHVALGQNYYSDSKYDFFFSNMVDTTIYKLKHMEETEAAISASYHFTDENIAVTYRYKVANFERIDLKDLHAAFCGVAKKILRSKATDVSLLDFFVSEEEYKRVRNERLANAFKKAHFLDKLKPEAQKLLYDKCQFKDLIMAEELTTFDAKYDRICIIEEGRFEMSGMSMDHSVHPLLILKEGDVIGIESFLDQDSTTTCIAFDSLCKVIEVPIEVLNEIAKDNADIQKDLLKIQTARLNKFQKLWMME